VLFLSAQIFFDRVCCDAQSERDIMFETAVHNLFFETREKQQEKTLWNARHARDVDFYKLGTLAPEEKQAPKMQSV